MQSNKGCARRKHAREHFFLCRDQSVARVIIMRTGTRGLLFNELTESRANFTDFIIDLGKNCCHFGHRSLKNYGCSRRKIRQTPTARLYDRAEKGAGARRDAHRERTPERNSQSTWRDPCPTRPRRQRPERPQDQE